MKAVVLGLLACLSIGCGGTASASADTKVSGTYTNPEGNASVEFMAGGEAHFSLPGVGGKCTFTQMDRNVVLTCEGDTTEFTVEDDGALTGPRDSFLTRLRKKT
jgi:hypothetical protein